MNPRASKPMALAMPTHFLKRNPCNFSSIHGAANTNTIDEYDVLGRVKQWTNPLGVFQQTYDPVNLLPKLSTAPNSQTTELFYEPAVGDLRLQEIRHRTAGVNMAAIVAANRRGCANRENSCIGSELLGKRSGTMTAWSPLYSSERFNPRSTHSMSCLPPTTSALLASFSHA